MVPSFGKSALIFSPTTNVYWCVCMTCNSNGCANQDSYSTKFGAVIQIREECFSSATPPPHSRSLHLGDHLYARGRAQNLSLGTRRTGRISRPNFRRSRAGWGFGAGGSKPPPHQLGRRRAREERCELPQRGSGGAPTAQRFSAIFSTQDGLS